MAKNVARFPREKVRRPLRFQAGKGRRYVKDQEMLRSTLKTFFDLEDSRPVKHPTLQFGPRGKVLLDTDQVWVDSMSVLWVIRSLEIKNRGKRNERTRVYVGPYLAEPHVLHSFAESTFRKLMRVWDVEAKHRQECYQDWIAECERRNVDPETGDRIE